MLRNRDWHKLHFVSRGSPNSGIYIIMLLLLMGQLMSGHTLPPTKQIVTVLVCFVVAISIHEFMHAFVALRLGDSTAERQGRVTLNPVSHFEPFGFMGMVLISLGYNFIGWGKPVPVNPSQLRALPADQRHRGMAIVALAGPLSNVFMAAIAAIIVRSLRGTDAQTGDIYYVASWFFWVNVLLASFNAIPLPPLDGYKIMVGILPRFWTPVLAPLERYGFLILFLIFFIGGRVGSSLTSEMIDPSAKLARTRTAVNAGVLVSEQSTLAYARKRLVQGLRGLTPGRAGAHVDRSVLVLLTPEQRAYFLQMPAFDQQHLCRVASYLREHGVTDRDVIVAGLLHDVGKTDGAHRVRLTDRVGKVVFKRVAPETLQRIAEGYPNGLCCGLALTVRHPEIGAEIARSLGCSERTCWLIRNHEAEGDLGDPDLALLQAADFAS